MKWKNAVLLFYIFFQWKILLVVIALTLLLVLLGVGGGVIALLLRWNIEESGHLFKLSFCMDLILKTQIWSITPTELLQIKLYIFMFS